MLRSLLLASLVGVSVAESASDCSAQNGRVTQLEEEILALKAELEQTQMACKDGQRISLTKMGSQCAAFGTDVVRHALSSTPIDHGQLFDKVSTSASAASKGVADFTSSVVQKVSSVNYAEHMQAIQDSDAVKKLLKHTESVQPYVDKAMPLLNQAKDACQPVLEKAEPVLAKAKDICEPIVTQALEKCAMAKATVQDQVIPTLLSSSAEVWNTGFGSALTKLDKLMTPVYEKAMQVAPQHQHALPHDPIDRVLFLLALVFLSYYVLYVALFGLRLALRWALKFLSTTTWVSFFGFRVLVFIPLSLILKIVSTTLWLATGFYCCGLCKSKKKADASSKSKKTDAKTTAKNGKAAHVTVADVEQLLKSAQGQKAKEQAVKKLEEFVKSGTPLSKPKAVEGKTLPKDVLLAACKKHGLKSSL